MRKYIFYCIASIMLVNTSCEQYDDLYSEEYHKILSIKTDNTIQELTLYSTGENAEYSFTVLKGGINPELSSEATISTMSEGDLKAYNEKNDLNFALIPEDYYSFSQTDLQFNGKEDRYKIVKVTLRTTAIKALIASSTDSKAYVLPIILKGRTDKDLVSPDLNMLILKPNVITPAVSFENPGTISSFCGKDGLSMEIPVILPIDNKWDFSCTVAADKSASLDKPILPDSYYSLENGGIVSFVAGKNKAILKLKINGLQNIDDNFVLPLKIVSSTKPGFDIDQRLLKLATSTKLELTSSMLSTNALEPTEGSLANLLDHNLATYFHSAWSVDVNGKHYVQVALPASITQFKFTYTNRQPNAAAAVKRLQISCSVDGQTFTNIRTLEGDADGLPYKTPAGEYVSSPFNIGNDVKYLRFTCVESTSGDNYFVWSEFGLWGL